MPSIHATAFLKDPGGHDPRPVTVLFGPQRHLKLEVFDRLKSLVLGSGDDEDIAVTRYSGKEIDFKTVADELRTVSMWGESRLVAVDDADGFVSEHRAGLERYLAMPAKKSLLVLLVKSWPKTTKLARAVAKNGLAVECAELKGAPLLRWLTDTCGDLHGKQISRDAANLIVEMAGTDLGLLNQELLKLVSFVGDRSRIGPEDVRAIVGGWSTQTTFVMTESLIAGRLDRALSLLDELLRAGESPYRIQGGIRYMFLKLATATESARHGQKLSSALAKAGIFRNRIAESERYLRRIGRPRAETITNQLLQADGELKGAARVTARLVLERLLVRLSGNPTVANQ